MYDLLTSSVLFVLLVPGVLVTLPPSGGLSAAIVHAIVFYVVQMFVSVYVPWWALWVVAVVVLGGKAWAARSATPAAF
jgi:hypothetical protein